MPGAPNSAHGSLISFPLHLSLRFIERFPLIIVTARDMEVNSDFLRVAFTLEDQDLQGSLCMRVRVCLKLFKFAIYPTLFLVTRVSVLLVLLVLIIVLLIVIVAREAV
ncbi:hypothetical protein BJX63DRAFT_380367 [Aspergillus granulosus]|uniref:Uncharacterized protein n=1 Tax=Aspergillus granulosus TaxID=176169 RepID=A0ABR4HXR4_9EURO